MADPSSIPSVAHELDGSAVQALEDALASLRGPAQPWHLSNWAVHKERYCADFRSVASIYEAGSLLEVGAAPCHMTALLHLSGYPITGVDLRPQRVQSLISAMQLDVRQCDVEREPLPFSNGQFAGVMLCAVFEHLRVDPAFVLSEINRVLALGGFLFLTTPNLYSLPSIARYLLGRSIADPLTEFGKLRALGHMGHVREYSSQEVSRFVRAFGFAAQSIRYEYQTNRLSRRGRILNVLYKVVPRRFHRDIVLVARKTDEVPLLEPLPDSRA